MESIKKQNVNFDIQKTYIKRFFFPTLSRFLEDDSLLSLQGNIGVGKTASLYYIIQELQKAQDINRSRIVYIDLKNDFNFTSLYEEIEKNSPYKTFLLLDNVDYKSDLKDLEKIFLKYQSLLKVAFTFVCDTAVPDFFDSNKIKSIYITPLSFSDFLQVNQVGNADMRLSLRELIKINENPNISRLFQEYIIYGGYPNVIKSEDNLAKQTFLAETVGKVPTDNLMQLRQTLNYLALNTGNLLNICELGSYIGFSRYKAEKNLTEIEKLNIVSFIPSLDTNIKKSLVKSYKIIFHDTGYRNGTLNLFHNLEQRIDTEGLCQNFLALYLMTLRETVDISFFRTTNQTEINLILENNEGVMPIQVVYSRNQNKIPRIFKSFKQNFEKNITSFLVVTKNVLKQEELDGVPVYFVPVHLVHFWEKLR